MSPPSLTKPFLKQSTLRWTLNCSVTAFILSVISILIASYALSFNLLPVPVKYAQFFAAKETNTRVVRTPPASVSNQSGEDTERLLQVYHSTEVKALQSSFLTNFFKSRTVSDDTTIVFQAVPFCGGDIFPGLVEKLLSANGKPRFAHVAEFTEQYPSLSNRTGKSEREKLGDFMREFIALAPKPLFLYVDRGSVPFIEGSNIHYVSLICDPAHRFIENFRVDHLNDDLQFALPRGMRMRTKPVSFESCFKRKLSECYGQSVQTFILSHFCADSAKCRSSNLNVPLETAMNLAERYTAVGHLEEFRAFLGLLEQKLPKYFSSVSEVFAQDAEFEGFRSKTGPLEGVSRPEITHDTFNRLQKHIWPDYGFYWKTRKLFMSSTDV